MITNLEYLRTALEVLESGESTEINQIKILRIMASICIQNAERMEARLVDKVEDRLYNTNTETVRSER